MPRQETNVLYVLCFDIGLQVQKKIFDNFIDLIEAKIAVAPIARLMTEVINSWINNVFIIIICLDSLW